MLLRYIILGCLLQSLSVCAIDVTISKSVFTDRMLKGTIAGKHHITIYLNYVDHAPDHRYTHSVKGWYWYDKIKTKIPLVGVYDGTLTLYQLENREQEDSLIHFVSKSEDQTSYWPILDEIKGRKNYLEKFQISEYQTQDKNKWTNKSSALSVQIYAKELAVYHEEEYLLVDGFDGFTQVYTSNIRQFTEYDKNFKLEKFKVIREELRVLLSFDYGSRAHAQTMCGAGSEKGFVLLVFNQKMELQDIKRELTESCNLSIWTSKESTIDNVTLYYVEVESNSNKRVLVDQEKLTLRSEIWIPE